MSKRKPLTWAQFWFIMWVIALISIAFPTNSSADDITLSWTNPTNQETCTDGGATTIDGINIWQKIATIDAPATEYVIPDKKPGVYTYGATAFNADGESRLSGVVEKTVTAFSVVDERAYIVAKTNGRFLLLVVGTVPLGTSCDPDTEVNGYNSVPIESVTFTGAQDVIVVAKCG